MVRVPAGSFLRGTNASGTNIDEGPALRVSMATYWIDRHEVTTANYRRCVARGRCDADGLDGERLADRPRGPSAACNYPATRERHPINCVTWWQAAAYCACQGKRLPTEAEWAKAARGSLDGRQYPWGQRTPSGETGPLANLADETARGRFPTFRVFPGYSDGAAMTAPVGSYSSGTSPWGVHDMIGNVLEWTADRYGGASYRQDRGPDPSGPSHGGYRVARGAAWDADPRTVRLTRRWPLLPRDRLHSLGFRCARSGTRSP